MDKNYQLYLAGKLKKEYKAGDTWEAPGSFGEYHTYQGKERPPNVEYDDGGDIYCEGCGHFPRWCPDCGGVVHINQDIFYGDGDEGYTFECERCEWEFGA